MPYRTGVSYRFYLHDVYNFIINRLSLFNVKELKFRIVVKYCKARMLELNKFINDIVDMLRDRNVKILIISKHLRYDVSTLRVNLCKELLNLINDAQIKVIRYVFDEGYLHPNTLSRVLGKNVLVKSSKEVYAIQLCDIIGTYFIRTYGFRSCEFTMLMN